MGGEIRSSHPHAGLAGCLMLASCIGVSLSACRFTVEEYLTIERKAPTKSEFHQGSILAMASGMPNHNLIASNVNGALWVSLKGGPCRIYSSDMRIAVASGEAVYYPDLSVICGELKLFGRHRDVAANPKLVVEVLSKSAGRYDRLVKLPLYQHSYYD
jgi:Uma2 family endonuclease